MLRLYRTDGANEETGNEECAANAEVTSLESLSSTVRARALQKERVRQV